MLRALLLDWLGQFDSFFNLYYTFIIWNSALFPPPAESGGLDFVYFLLYPPWLAVWYLYPLALEPGHLACSSPASYIPLCCHPACRFCMPAN